MSALDYESPEKYIGNYSNIYMGYSSREDIREGAASGGVVSTLLIHLLSIKEVDGVFISRQKVIDDRIEVECFIAETEEEILDSRTSIYTFFPLEKHFNKIESFEGNVAAVLLPCHIKMLESMKNKRPELYSKVKYKFALFCGGVANNDLMYQVLKQNSIDIKYVDRIYARKGHWRGVTYIQMKSGEERKISYTKNWSTYKNAFFFSTPKCFSCKDHFGYTADFSFGDIWTKEMKRKKQK